MIKLPLEVVQVTLQTKVYEIGSFITTALTGFLFNGLQSETVFM